VKDGRDKAAAAALLRLESKLEIVEAVRVDVQSSSKVSDQAYIPHTLLTGKCLASQKKREVEEADRDADLEERIQYEKSPEGNDPHTHYSLNEEPDDEVVESGGLCGLTSAESIPVHETRRWLVGGVGGPKMGMARRLSC